MRFGSGIRDGQPEPVQPPEPFTAWIRSLVAARRERSASPAESIGAGRQQSAAAGVSLIGEISTSDEATATLSATGPRLVLFREILGLRRDRIPALLTLAQEHLARTP